MRASVMRDPDKSENGSEVHPGHAAFDNRYWEKAIVISDLKWYYAPISVVTMKESKDEVPSLPISVVAMAKGRQRCWISIPGGKGDL